MATKRPLLGTWLHVSTRQTGWVSPELGSSSTLALYPEQTFWASCPHKRLKALRVRHSASTWVPHHIGILGHRACIAAALRLRHPAQVTGSQDRRQKPRLSGPEVLRVGPRAAWHDSVCLATQKGPRGSVPATLPIAPALPPQPCPSWRPAAGA